MNLELRKIIVLICMVYSCSGFGQWLCPWENRQELRVKENSGTVLQDYQIKLEVPFTTGMNADYSDLRFTSSDGTTLLSFFVEIYDNTRAVVWLKIPNLPAKGSVDIYMYYCNTSAASASNPDKTFLFYDDFDQFNGWQQYRNGDVEQDLTTFPGTSTLAKVGSCDPSGGYKLLGQQLEGFRLVAREHRKNEGGDCTLNRYGLEDENFDGYSLRRSAMANGNGSFGFERRNNGSGNNYQSTNLAQPKENWYRTEFTRCPDGSNGSLIASLYDDAKNIIGSKSGQDNTYDSFDRVIVHGGRPYYFDFLAVGKYVCKEPTIKFRSTESDLPVAICKSIEVELDENGNYTLDPSLLNNGSTDCNTLTFSASQTAFTCDDLGENKVFLTVTDPHGNEDDCSAKINVIDIINPVVQCPDDITIMANANNCSAVVTWSDPVVIENCKIDKIEASHSSGDVFLLGDTKVNYEYIDQSGNSGNCTFIVTVLSNAATPEISISDTSGNISNDGIICQGDQACLNPTTGFISYLWNTNATTEQLCVGDPGDYAVTVTNSIGCTAASDVIEIEQLEIPTAGTCLISNDLCQLEEGIVRIQVANGAPPYTVNWMPSIGSNSSGTILQSGDFLNIENIPGGTTLDISIVDDNGCQLE